MKKATRSWLWALAAAAAVVGFVWFVLDPKFLYTWGLKKDPRTYTSSGGGEVDLEFVDSLGGFL